MTASETHTSVDPDVQFCSIVQEVTYKANSAYVVSLKSFGFLWTTEEQNRDCHVQLRKGEY